MTATPKELAHAAELRNALAELEAVALAARTIVKDEADRYLDGQDGRGSIQAVRLLDRLDCALADAAGALERSSS